MGTFMGKEVDVIGMDGEFSNLAELCYIESHMQNVDSKFSGELTQAMIKDKGAPGSNNGSGFFIQKRLYIYGANMTAPIHLCRANGPTNRTAGCTCLCLPSRLDIMKNVYSVNVACTSVYTAGRQRKREANALVNKISPSIYIRSDPRCLQAVRRSVCSNAARSPVVCQRLGVS